MTAEKSDPSLVQLRTKVNGRDVACHIHADETALEFLRTQQRLHGVRLSCGQGSCGACTVSVDGTTAVSCLLPATSLEGRSVTTIESLNDPTLHPVQRAFLAEDALQCGFCTPGFVLEAVQFFGRWRAAHGTRTPSRELVAEALAGHLCRCGAYEHITRAVQRACEGAFDQPTPTEQPRRDAREKVTGEARYTTDIVLEGMLEGRVLRAPYASARVKRLDFTAARALEGVRAVYEMIGPSRRVRYVGQEIAAVAAVDARTALKALALIAIEYEVGRPVIEMAAAREKNAPLVYGSFCSKFSAPVASEGPKIPALWFGNVRGPFCIFTVCGTSAKKIVARARKGQGTLGEGTFRTAYQTHTALEPHGCVARWIGPDRLEAHVSSQAVTRMKEDIATRWKIPAENVTVLSKHVGGGFGSKAEVGPEVVAAIELARAANAPVRVVLEHREELVVGGFRPAQEIALAVAAKPDGSLGAVTMKAYGDAGIAVGNLTTGMVRFIYPGVPKELYDWDVVTNAPAGKPFRGPGGPPAFFALEQCVDQCARQRNEDPITLRRRWDPHPQRQQLYDWIESLSAWKSRRKGGHDTGRYRRGMGFASSGWFYFTQPTSEVRVDVHQGQLRARCAVQDMGNGTTSAIANAVAAVFGLPSLTVNVEIGDSSYPDGPTSAGSRTTSSIVAPSEQASLWVREELVQLAAKKFSLRDAHAIAGGIAHDGGKFLPWSDVLPAFEGVGTTRKREKDTNGFLLPFTIADMAVGKYFTAGVQLTEVEVDTRLGKTKVKRVWGGFASGRIIAPVLARSQAIGGITQGIGYTLYEERRLDHKVGFVLTESFDNYHLPGIGDMPEMTLHFVEDGFDDAQGRTVGLGELVTLAPAASIANAIYDATGWRPFELPIRPDRVLRGMAQ